MINSNFKRRLLFSQKGSAFILELIKVVVICLAIIIPVRYFLIQPFYVKGASMEPNFYDHEYLVIDELAYRLRTPKRGEIIVFHYPKDPRQYFIKRIIALPGEEIIISDGQVTIYNQRWTEGKLLDESSYLPAGVRTLGEVDLKLKADEYFVMGDNRNFSLDSRSFGEVPGENIVGRTWFRGWPIDRITHFELPEYNL